MATKRRQKKIWVTSLSRLMMGEQKCPFSAWFEANYTYHDEVMNRHGYTINYAPKSATEKSPELLERDEKHSRLADRVIKELEKEGRYLLPEVQFWHETDSGLIVAGRTDLISVLKRMECCMYDFKTGREKNSDIAQVMLYMRYNPIKEKYQSLKLRGFVVYEQKRIEVPNDLAENGFAEKAEDYIHLLSSDKEPEKIASDPECWNCRVKPEDCKEREKTMPA